jgi:hypothetical protein
VENDEVRDSHAVQLDKPDMSFRLNDPADRANIIASPKQLSGQ